MTQFKQELNEIHALRKTALQKLIIASKACLNEFSRPLESFDDIAAIHQRAQERKRVGFQYDRHPQNEPGFARLEPVRQYELIQKYQEYRLQEEADNRLMQTLRANSGSFMQQSSALNQQIQLFNKLLDFSQSLCKAAAFAGAYADEDNENEPQENQAEEPIQ
jgi:hypothetical protein